MGNKRREWGVKSEEDSSNHNGTVSDGIVLWMYQLCSQVFKEHIDCEEEWLSDRGCGGRL